jgi:anti-anti-sigma factor
MVPAVELKVSSRSQGDHELVVATGEIDLYTAPRLQSELAAVIASAAPASRVVVDMSGVEFCDSTGMNVLLSCLRQARERGGELELADPRPAVRKILSVTGLDAVFTVQLSSGGPRTPRCARGTPGPASKAADCCCTTIGVMTSVAVVIPAFNEAERIGETVTAALTLPCVDAVVVASDGSTDATVRAARDAGATVWRSRRNQGKAAAMLAGAEAVRALDLRDRRDGARHLLFLDADLGQTAGNAGPLIEPVAAGTADMTIAVFANRVKLAGHGFVVRLSGAGISRATGWTPAQPLNGQRCLTRAAFEAARPLARGFGVETAMTIDLKRKGLRIVEVEVDMAHRATGGDLAAQLHRARQFGDVTLALVPRVAFLLRCVTVIVLNVILIAIAAAGGVAGLIGIVAGVAAGRRAGRAVRECRDLVQGAVGSRGTVDPRAVRDVAIVRYDALSEMSGQLSFSLALLNAMGDGVVLSSINGRAETRTYAKPVVAGQGQQELSPEEAQAVHSARLGTTLSRVIPGPAGERERASRRAAATA